DLVGVGQTSAEEASHECDSGANRERLGGPPFDALYVAIPACRIVGITCVLGDLAARPADLDLRHDVHPHRATISASLELSASTNCRAWAIRARHRSRSRSTTSTHWRNARPAGA